MPAAYWLDLTTEDFRTRDMHRTIAVLPVAAVEQHGPHLPVGVDTFINQGYLARAAALVPEDLDVLVLPIQAVGKSNEHLAFPGTLTLSAETVIRAWTEIGESVHRAGVPQARLPQLARRQRRRHRHRRARAARPPRDARGERGLAPARLSARPLLARGDPPRHPWRRCRNLADARLPPADRADGRGAELRAGDDRDGTALQAPLGNPADRLRLDEPGPQSHRRDGRGGQGHGAEGRG